MEHYKDTYQYQGLRKKLVEELKQKGIKDTAVLRAFEKIPRHFFFEKAFAEWAYQNKAFPIGKGQTISQPFTVAFQTELLDIKKRESVMEIGTGSGFQAAVLATLGARVYTIERHEALHISAKQRLKKMGYAGIRFYFKDGYKGLPEFAPFDKILVTAAAPEIPQALKMQLKVGGKLVVPVGDEKGQKMLLITRLDQQHFEEKELGNFKFVPFLKGISRK